MKAAVFYGSGDLRVEERAIPTPKDDEVLIRVHACGVCGTDVHIFHGDEGAAKTPRGTVLGHEFSGEIAAVGKNVTARAVGDRVCVDPNQLCGRCTPCLTGYGHFCEHMTGIGTTVDGGFAEYVAVPYYQTYRFDPSLTYAEAAMTEPVSCCLHGIDLCDIIQGDTVAVIGCGMIGLLMLQLARLRGAGRIIAVEPVESKREAALKLGADAVYDPNTVTNERIIAENGRIACVIECVGRTSTMESAVSLAGYRATVMLFGLTAPDDTLSVKPFTVFKKELTLRASFINPYTFTRALALIASKKIDVASPVYRYTELDTLPEVLENPEARREGKIIVTM